MIGSIRKHSKVLWIIVIAAVIVSFVIYFSPNVGQPGGAPRGNFGSMNGRAISAEEYLSAWDEVRFRYFLRFGTFPGQDRNRPDFNEQEQTYQRLLLIRALGDHNIRIGPEAVARQAREILRNLGGESPVPLQTFEQQVLRPSGLTINDFERSIRHDLGIQQLIGLIGLGGELITPEEARALYVREHQELATLAAFFSASNYLDRVEAPTPQQIGEFYTNYMSQYWLPERVQVGYVRFNPTNFEAQVEQQLTNINELVEGNLAQLGTNYGIWGETEQEAREKIRSELFRRQSLFEAHNRASQFLDELLAMEPVRAESLAALATQKELEVQVTDPFDMQTGPAEFDGGPNFGQAAFALSQELPIAEGPLVGEDGVFVIAMNERLPAQPRLLEEIREKVAEDYLHTHAAQLARLAGAQFAQAATNGLTQGKTFAELAAAHNARTVPVAVSLKTQDSPALEGRIDLRTYRQVAVNTPVGEVTEFVPTPEGGVVIQVQERRPIDESQMAADMPAFTESVRNARAQETFGTWFSKEWSRALQTLPAIEPAQGRS